MHKHFATATLLGLIAAMAMAQPPAFKKNNLSAKEIKAALATPVDPGAFDKPMSLKEALSNLHQILLKKKGKAIGFTVNQRSFAQLDPAAPDVLETPVRLKAGKAQPASKILASILAQVSKERPNQNATFEVRDGHVEIVGKKVQ